MSQLFDIDKEMSWYSHDTDPAIVNQAKIKRKWRERGIMRDKPVSKQVHQYGHDGRYIRSFDSAADACGILDCEKQAISFAARNEGRYTAAGHYWSYELKELIVKK